MLKYYAKIFVVTGIVFFLGIFFPALNIMPARRALAEAIANAIVFATALSLIMGTLHVVKARKAAAGETGRDIYSVRQSRSFESPLGRDRLFAAASSFLKGPLRCVITESDPAAGRLAAHTPIDLATFGSSVGVRLEGTPEGPTLVTVVSKPLLFFMLADYGENLRISRAVEQQLRGLGAASGQG
ncbi:MAG: hypothetical protein M0011_03600 [Elusimicrobia bacterium]|nr:hypothetical protein [Elusimicrobiota bacterium]